MAWEEQNCGPYLPAAVLQKLIAEHRRLENAGFPDSQMLQHSKWEEAMFRRYCPPEICDQVLVDHEEYEVGNLRSRNPALRTATLA